MKNAAQAVIVAMLFLIAVAVTTEYEDGYHANAPDHTGTARTR